MVACIIMLIVRITSYVSCNKLITIPQYKYAGKCEQDRITTIAN